MGSDLGFIDNSADISLFLKRLSSYPVMIYLDLCAKPSATNSATSRRLDKK